MACCAALVSPCGAVEIVNSTSSACSFVHDVLQEPVHSLRVGQAGTLFYSTAAFLQSEVNDFASGLAQQLIKGDACLVHEQRQPLVDCLLQSKQLRISQTEALSCLPRTNSNSSCHAVHTVDAQQLQLPPAGCDCSSGGSSANSSCCVLTRPRSMQHIAAANSARQRILRSMSATGAAAMGAAAAAVAAHHGDAQRPSSSFSRSTPSSSGFLPGATTTPSARLPPTSSSSGRRMPALPTGCSPECVESASSSSSTSSTVSFFESSHSPRNGGSQGSQAPVRPAAAPLQQHSVMSGSAAAGAAAFDDAAGCVQERLDQQLREEAARVAAAAEAPAAADVAAVTVVWTDLPVEVIAQVARFLGSTVSAVMPIFMTCRSWRQAVLEDDQLLLGLTFKLDTAAPRNSGSSSHSMQRARLQHPLLLERASKLGNVSALVVRARLLDAAGLPDEAMRCWRRAAKAGHLEGQLLFGLALYRGTSGVAPDAEDAHLWLNRALKQVLAAKPPPAPANNTTTTAATSSSDAGVSAGSNNNNNNNNSSQQQQGAGGAGAGDSSSSNGPPAVTPAVAAAPPRCLAAVAAATASSRQQGSLHTRVLTQAGLVLGYLSFDGEGTKTDTQEAVRCFKLAAQAGCREAQQVLGWMYNTGQF